MRKRSLFCRSLILSLLLYPSSDVWSVPFTGQIPLRGNSMSLLEVVKEIEETTDYSFFTSRVTWRGPLRKTIISMGTLRKYFQKFLGVVELCIK